MGEKKKMGRPTENPKNDPIHIRLDDECSLIIERYCKQENISRAEGIRQGIKKLAKELK